MGFQVSPGVQVKEIDLTNVIPAVSTSIGAIAGAFQWGPVMDIVTLGSEKQLVDNFGPPDDDTFEYFMPAASFLKYGDTLRVVRAKETDGTTHHMVNARTGGAGSPRIYNDDEYPGTGMANTMHWIARYPGELGNSLQVSICGTIASGTQPFEGWEHKELFDSAPTTSDYVADKLGSLDELHFVVRDTTGAWGFGKNYVLETFAFLSQAGDAVSSDGTNNFYKEVINSKSDYIWFGDIAKHRATMTKAGDFAQVGGTGTAFVFPTSAETLQLAGGVSPNAPDMGDIKTAYEMFADTETVDVNLIIAGHGGFASQAEAVEHSNNIIAIAKSRMDCVAFVSPQIEATVRNDTAADDVKTYADLLTSSSYGVIDSTALYVYDKYSDVYRWIHAAGAVAGLCAYTDDVTDPWWSPAGFNRGQLMGVTKIAFNPKKFERDTLYKARVNPIVTFPGEGTLLYGDKTAQSKPSAFDRINVRRLFIVLEKAISTAAKYMLFEFNDEFTRAQFRNMVEPFLRDVKGRRGIYDFLVVCDETNNTGQVIDTNRFIADIYIKPARSINFMTLNFIATRTGVEFSEIVGKF
jgi:phage tail sheath protein FI